MLITTSDIKTLDEVFRNWLGFYNPEDEWDDMKLVGDEL
jgi:hypothetical protein